MNTLLERVEHALEYVRNQMHAEALALSATSEVLEFARFAERSVISATQHQTELFTFEFHRDERVTRICTSSLTPESLSSACKCAHAQLTALPKDPEYVPLVSTQSIQSSSAVDAATRALGPHDLAEQIDLAHARFQNSEIFLAGFVSTALNESIFASTSGVRASYSETVASCSCTARSNLYSGSSRATAAQMSDVSLINCVEEAARVANQKVAPRPLVPGKYVAVLMPSAVLDLAETFVQAMDRRAADEGRSYFSSVNERVEFPRSLVLLSDPADQRVPTASFSSDGMPVTKSTWLKDGKICALPTDRYWGARKGLAAIPKPGNFVVTAGDSPLHEIVASVEHGILVEHLWYIRSVDPQQLLVTGLTRDGVFLIEDGRISAPLMNFRFNASPARLFSSIELASMSARAVGSENRTARGVVPAIKVPAFDCSSISDAI